MKKETSHDFQELISKHNTEVQNKIDKVNKLNVDDIEDLMLENGLDTNAKSFLLGIYSNKATSSFLDEVEGNLSIPLPISYRNLLTNIGLLRYGSSKGFSTEESYKMLPPHEIYPLSEALEKEWEIDWSKKQPILKKQADKLIIFALGDYDQQGTYYLCFDLRTTNESSKEASIYSFSQDEWGETIGSPEKYSYLKGSTVETYLTITSNDILSLLDYKIEALLDNIGQ